MKRSGNAEFSPSVKLVDRGRFFNFIGIYHCLINFCRLGVAVGFSAFMPENLGKKLYVSKICPIVVLDWAYFRCILYICPKVWA